MDIMSPFALFLLSTNNSQKGKVSGKVTNSYHRNQSWHHPGVRTDTVEEIRNKARWSLITS